MTLIPWLVAIYAVICVAAYFGNRMFMYFPDPTRAAPAAVGLNGVKEVEIAVADGIALIAWHPDLPFATPFFISRGNHSKADFVCQCRSRATHKKA